MATKPAAVLLLLCAALLTSGCITRHVRQDVYHEGTVEVFLRSDRRNFSPVEKGYDHPVTISSVRMAHILSRLDVRKSVDEGGRRIPAVPTELLYEVAEGMSQALARADVDQEVVVMAIQEKRTLRVFGEDYLTSLVSYVRGDKLYVHLARTDWLVPQRRKDNPPQPEVGEKPTKLRIFPGHAMTLLDTNSVAIAWRDPVFSRPTRTRILPSGEVVRKTILLESPAEGDGEGVDEGEAVETVPLPPEGLTPAQLRALADLEEERLAGKITEAEYRMRQLEIVNSP